MNHDQDTCHVDRATQKTSEAASPGVHTWSDKTVLGSLLIGVNMLLFVLIQSGNLGFEKGDFKMFYTAAIALRTGSVVDIYSPESYVAVERRLVPTLPLANVQPYTRPPYELLAILPFSFLSYQAACCCWQLLTLLLAAICGRVIGSYATVFGMFPFLIVLLMQQDSMLALLSLIGCWFALRKDRDMLAGFILGLALFKFQIIIPLAIVLAFWRPKLLNGIIVSGITVFSISLAMVRPAGMIGYWRYLVGMARASSAPVSAYRMDPNQNVALRGFVYELLGSYGFLFPIVTCILGLFILVMAWRFMRDCELPSEVKFSFAVISALLLSFHLLTHDLILLSLPFVLLAGSKARWPLAVLYITPLLLPVYIHTPAWLAVITVSSLAAMIVVYVRNPLDFRQQDVPQGSKMVMEVTRQVAGT